MILEMPTSVAALKITQLNFFFKNNNYFLRGTKAHLFHYIACGVEVSGKESSL